MKTSGDLSGMDDDFDADRLAASISPHLHGQDPTSVPTLNLIYAGLRTDELIAIASLLQVKPCRSSHTTNVRMPTLLCVSDEPFTDVTKHELQRPRYCWSDGTLAGKGICSSVTSVVSGFSCFC